MANKKVILLIVEGQSDERVLSTITDKLNNENVDLKFELIHGDSFTKGSNQGAKSIVKDSISRYLNKSKIQAKQITFVGYIVDVDGIYIAECDVKCNTEQHSDYFQYDKVNKKVIFGSNLKMRNVQKKWQRKKRRLDMLQAKDFSIKMKEHTGSNKTIEIPVQVYFNNITLEHVLVGELLRGKNSIEDKQNIARAFQKNIEGSNKTYEDAKDFFDAKKPEGVTSNEDSWNFIKQYAWQPCSSIFFLLEKLEHIYMEHKEQKTVTQNE
ncbi:hypothetical protein [Pediococcus pentosaceus]